LGALGSQWELTKPWLRFALLMVSHEAVSMEDIMNCKFRAQCINEFTSLDGLGVYKEYKAGERQNFTAEKDLDEL
jgi:hypothetical protein